jgi:hypothetical protein
MNMIGSTLTLMLPVMVLIFVMALSFLSSRTLSAASAFQVGAVL